jgi:hypothetical protein
MKERNRECQMRTRKTILTKLRMRIKMRTIINIRINLRKENSMKNNKTSKKWSYQKA